MAKTQALGTILRVESNTPSVYTTVAGLTSISVPGPTKPDIDVTDFDSVAAEFLPGLPDSGELALSGFFNGTDGGQMIMLTDAHDPAAPVRTFQIEFTRQDKEFIFDGYVKSFVPNAGGPGEAYTFDAVIRVTGAVAISDIS